MGETELNYIKSFLLKLKTKISNENDTQTLVYALGLLNKQIFSQDNNIKHLAVIGPTQAGKSTLVNLLLGTDDAKASMRAAFTRKAYGFTQRKIDEALQSNLQNLFSYDQSLKDKKGAEFNIVQTKSQQFTDWIIWDTADFDSVAAREYKESTLLLYALADIVLLVVSKEKYADLSVWQTLRLGRNTHQPLLVFVNKVDLEDANQTAQFVQDKFTAEKINATTINTLPYVAQGVEGGLKQHSAILSARELIKNYSINESSMLDELKDYLDSHWPNWTDALEQEIAANKNWQQIVDRSLQEASEAYARDYLQNTIYGETMQQVMLKLLVLLEIPQIANTLGKVRSVITWPVRTLFSKLKSQTENMDSPASSEARVLQELYQNTSASLLRKIGDKALTEESTKNWWQGLWRVFKQENESISDEFKRKIKHHQTAFEPQIAKTAEDVYQKIKTEPVTLNGLRAARASVDAAAVFFALKTGGIGAHDLFLTPAMLAFTTLMTESAVGHYLKKAEAQLKVKQVKSVEEIIFKQYQIQLLTLPAKISADKIYAIQAEDLSQANHFRKNL